MGWNQGGQSQNMEGPTELRTSAPFELSLLFGLKSFQEQKFPNLLSCQRVLLK